MANNPPEQNWNGQAPPSGQYPTNYPPGAYAQGNGSSVPYGTDRPKRPWYKKPGCLIPLILLLGLFLFGGCIAAFMPSTGSTPTQPAPATTSARTSGAGKSEPAQTDAAGSDVPAEYESALAKADSYANGMHMSKKGLYDQLTSEYGEKFSPKAAKYAVDHVQTDWNANALAKAQSYQTDMKMSPRAIHDQLISENGEQFTKAEADYALKHLEK